MPEPITQIERVPMRDGACLTTEITRVDDGARRPVLLYRTPYGRDAVRNAYATAASAEMGWVAVNEDCRGRYGSDGVFTPAYDEGPDGYDTVQWCAAQPWSDGRVVMAGQSYIGFTSWLAAMARPPALKGIVSRISTSDFGADVIFEGGALQSFGVTWSLNMDSTDPYEKPAAQRRCAALANDIEALRTPWGRSPIPKASKMVRRWLTEPGVLADLGTAKRRKWAAAPAFQITGWFDLLVEGALRTYIAQRKRGVTQRLIVGPWSHGGEFARTCGELDFGPSAHAKWAAPESIKWLQAAADGQAWSGVKLFVMGANKWIDAEQWPPASTDQVLCPHEDGTLANAPGRGSIPLPYDPRNPVPTRGGLAGGFAQFSGPADQREIEARDDVLVFTGPALKAPVTVIGTVRAQVELSSDAASADVHVKLVDVYPDGRAMSVCDSLQRTTGTRKLVKLEIGSTALKFGRGHRIRIEIAASNFPRIDLNSSTGDQMSTVRRKATHTVHLAKTAVTLPVV